MKERDPRVDPQPGDILRKGNREIVVHFVKGGEVYFGEVYSGTTTTLGGWRISIEGFRDGAAEAEVREFLEVK